MFSSITAHFSVLVAQNKNMEGYWSWLITECGCYTPFTVVDPVRLLYTDTQSLMLWLLLERFSQADMKCIN